jgi:hypothetical protein
MTSRFDTCYYGGAKEVVKALESPGGDYPTDYLRVALINAMHRIAKLEEDVRDLEGRVRDVSPQVD